MFTTRLGTIAALLACGSITIACGEDGSNRREPAPPAAPATAAPGTAAAVEPPEGPTGAGSAGATPATSPDEGAKTVSRKAATVRVTLDAQTQARIKEAMSRPPGAAGSTVRLEIRGVVPPAEKGPSVDGLKVFLNKPDANTETSVTDPHWADSVAFSPTTDTEPQGFNINLTHALHRLQKRGELQLDRPLVITLAAVPADEKAGVPPEVVIPFKDVTVVVPRTASAPADDARPAGDKDTEGSAEQGPPR